MIDCVIDTAEIAVRYPITSNLLSNAMATSTKVNIEDSTFTIESHLKRFRTLRTEVVVPVVAAKKSRSMIMRNSKVPSVESSIHKLSVGAIIYIAVQVTVAIDTFSNRPSLTIASASNFCSLDRYKLRLLSNKY